MPDCRAQFLWGETFTIDAWGNLTNKAGVSGKTNTETLNAAPASRQNQLNGYCSDAAGNLGMNSNCGGTYNPAYSYDAENRLISTAGMTYVYDGDGKRVEKCTAGTLGQCATSATGTLYWTGTNSDPMVETDLSGNLLENYIFFDGKRIARREPGTTPTFHFYFSDRLGTHSLITDANGNMPPQYEADFYPYGGEIPITTGDSNHYKFTGKERDSESGLDMFGARYYGSSLGRFMTPDWATKPTDVPYADFGNPQSLNLYSYVKNNPTTTRDEDGHCAEDACIGEGAVVAIATGVVFTAATIQYYRQNPDAGAALSAGASAARQTLSNAIDKIGSFFHPDNSGKAASPPGTTTTNVATGTPASTSQQGAVDTSPAQMAGGPKAGNAPGVTAGGQATDQYGNKLGPSGETQVDTTRSNTREGARNRALNEGSGAVEHSNPTEGNPHFHPTDNKGNKKPSSTHHEYPD